MSWYLTKDGPVYVKNDYVKSGVGNKPANARQKRKENYRTAYCKNCGEPLDSREDEICPDCGWIICPSCGDCGCS